VIILNKFNKSQWYSTRGRIYQVMSRFF